MGKLLGTLLKIITSLAILVIILLVVLAVVVDPNQYKPAIESAVLENTGLELNIAGDLSLSFQPYIGISLADVRLRNPERPQELASSSQVSLRVDPFLLLKRQLLVQELRADDFHVNWYVDANGTSLWQTDMLKEESASATPGDNGEISDSMLSANIAVISINNASIDIQNLQQNYYYTIQNLDLVSRGGNLQGRLFPLEAQFDLLDRSRDESLPFTLNSSNRIDLENGVFGMPDFQLLLSPMQLLGNVEARSPDSDLTWQAEMTSNTFPLPELMKYFSDSDDGDLPFDAPGVNNEQSRDMTVRIELRGDSNGVEIPVLHVELGDLELDSEASIRFANQLAPTNIRYEITTNAIDLTPYEEDSTTAATGSPNPAGSSTPPDVVMAGDTTQSEEFTLPRTLLTDMNVQGTIALESLLYRGMQFGPINIFTNLENDVLDIESQPTSLLGGNVQGNMRVDSTPDESEITLQFSTSNINVAEVALPLLDLQAISGRLNLEANYTGQGNTLSTWLEDLSGTTTFSVDDSTVNIGVIKQVFTAISALSPGGGVIQQWPDVIQFQEFTGYALMRDGIRDDQQIKVRLDNFDITGSGGFDPRAGTFDYDFLFTVLSAPYRQSIPISERYHNISWPVQCGAGFDDPVTQFCRPDFPQVRQLFIQLSNNQLQRRLEDTVTDEVPEELQDSARGLLRNLFPN